MFIFCRVDIIYCHYCCTSSCLGQIAVDQFANIGGSGSIADGLFQPRNVSNNDTGNHRPKPTLGVI